MSDTMEWILALTEAQEENRNLHTQLQAKEDHITALQTEILRLRTVMGVMAKHIPQTETVTRTVTYL